MRKHSLEQVRQLLTKRGRYETSHNVYYGDQDPNRIRSHAKSLVSLFKGKLLNDVRMSHIVKRNSRVRIEDHPNRNLRRSEDEATLEIAAVIKNESLMQKRAKSDRKQKQSTPHFPKQIQTERSTPLKLSNSILSSHQNSELILSKLKKTPVPSLRSWMVARSYSSENSPFQERNQLLQDFMETKRKEREEQKRICI